MKNKKGMQEYLGAILIAVIVLTIIILFYAKFHDQIKTVIIKGLEYLRGLLGVGM